MIHEENGDTTAVKYLPAPAERGLYTWVLGLSGTTAA